MKGGREGEGREGKGGRRREGGWNLWGIQEKLSGRREG